MLFKNMYVYIYIWTEIVGYLPVKVLKTDQFPCGLRPSMLQGAKQFGLFGNTGSSGDAPDPRNTRELGNGKPGDQHRDKKPKKPVGMKKQCGQKKSMLSNKLTDLKVLRNKVEHSPLLLGIHCAIICICSFLYILIYFSGCSPGL